MSSTTVANGVFGASPEIVASVAFGQATAAVTAMQNLFTYTASTQQFAIIGRYSMSGPVTGADFRTGVVSTVGAVMKMELQGVDSSGLPNGTTTPAGAIGSVVVDPADDNVFKSVSFASTATVTQGDPFALVLSVSSGTPNSLIIAAPPNSYMVLSNFPYATLNSSGTWQRAGTVPPAWSLNYNSTAQYLYGLAPINAMANTTIGNGNERALRFVFPGPVGVRGAKIFLANVSTNADFRVSVCASDGTVLQQIERTPADIDGQWVAGPTVDSIGEFYFASTQPFAANAAGYLSVAQRTAGSMALTDFSVIEGYMSACPGGAGFYLGTRTGSSGAFTDVTTTRPLIHLLIGAIDDGAGGGGGGARNMLVNPGMSGGTNG